MCYNSEMSPSEEPTHIADLLNKLLHELDAERMDLSLENAKFVQGTRTGVAADQLDPERNRYGILMLFGEDMVSPPLLFTHESLSELREELAELDVAMRAAFDEPPPDGWQATPKTVMYLEKLREYEDDSPPDGPPAA